MTERIHESSNYAGLSHFLTNLTKRNKESNTLSKGQLQRLKELLYPLITQILNNIDSNELLDQEQKNLHFILDAVSLYLKQNLEPELESQISELQEQISTMKKSALDDQQDTIINAEKSLINRIADKLNSRKPINNEDELTSFVLMKVSKYDQLVSDIIKKFDLPKKTKKDQIIEELESKFNMQTVKPQKQVTFSFREELSHTSEELSKTKSDVERLNKRIAFQNEQIRRLQEEKKSIKQQLDNSLMKIKEMQENENLNSSNNEIIDSNARSQIESLKAELLSSQLENEKKGRKIEKKRNYIKKIEEKIAEDEKIMNELQSENEKLNAAIEKTKDSNEIDTLRHQLDNNFSEENAELKKKIEMKNQEIQKLRNLFDELTAQFDQQNNELADISTGRIELVTYVQRLNEVCKLLETQLEFSNGRVRDLSSNLEESLIKNEELERQQQSQQFQITQQSPVQQSLDLTFLDTVRQLAEESIPSSSKQIGDIVSDEEVSIPQRIMHLFSFVIETLSKKCKAAFFNDGEDELNLAESSNNLDLQNMGKLASKFYTAALSELKFIQDLANSKSMQSWVIGRNDEEIRFQLQTQCARLESFISENCDHLANDRSQMNLFDYLLVNSYNNNTSSLSANAAEFIDRFKDPKTSEGKQLYLMLLQALTANDILQRYSIEARKQCDLQTKEIRQLRNLNDFTEREIIQDQPMDNEYDENSVENDDGNGGKKQRKSPRKPKAKASTPDVIERIRSIIRTAIADEKNLNELLTMLECIDALDNESIDTNKYTRKIEKKLYQEMSDSQETKSKLETIVNQTNSELNVLKTEMKKLDGEYQKKNKDLQKEIANRDNTITSLNRKLSHSSSQYESLLQESKKNSSLIEEENNKMSIEMQNEIDETRRKYDEIVNELKNEVSEMQQRVEASENEHKEKILSIKASSKKKQAKLVTALRDIQTKLEKSESEKFTKISELTKQLEHAQKGEEEAVQASKKLSEEINDLRSKISTLTVEHKMMNSRLASKDEKMKRDKALFESQLKLRLFAAESDCKAKVETMKNEMNLKTQEFMTRICRTFKEMFYVNQPVNESTVEQILSKVRERLTMLEKDSFAAEEANHELKVIRELLEQSQSPANHPIKFIKASTSVNEIIEKKKQLEKENALLEQQAKSFEKDIVEARAVLMQNSNNKDWEDWARKLYALISGGFNLARTPREIKNTIEEAIFAAIGNKIVWRKLDCLRAEKKLILRGALRVKPKKGLPPSLTQLITIPIVIGRLQKMSGHLQPSLSLYREEPLDEAQKSPQQKQMNSEQKQSKNSQASISKKDQQKKSLLMNNGPTSRAPLFSKFIVESNFNIQKNDE